LGVQESIKATQGKETEVIQRYNIRKRRRTLVDDNKSITEQDKKKMQVVVKIERVDDNHQVKALKQKNKTLQQ